MAFGVLKVVGASVLLVMGIRSWRQAWRTCGVADGPPMTRRRSTALVIEEGASVWGGLVVRLANPKAAVLMVALHPQFIPADRNLFTTTAVLAVLQVDIETILYLGLAAGVGRARGWFARSTVGRRLEYFSGTVSIALGLRVATTSH